MNNKVISIRKLSALVLVLIISLPVFALDLSDAKSQGLVGETYSGYLKAIKPSAEVNALVVDINSQRKMYYQRIADKNSISLEAVEARAGQKAIEKTPSGEYVDTGSGWGKKQ